MPAHRLGTHTVGQRVVVRRIVPGQRGPTGGPAFTDVLGELLAWQVDATPGGGEALVRDGEGVEHRIPLALVVSGKPVPPRASVRDRVPAEVWQHAAARSFPAATTEHLGAWRLRDQPDQDRRVARLTSALAVGDPGRDLGAAVAHVRAWYADRGREPWLSAVVGSEAYEAVLASGWVAARREAPTQTWLGPVARGVRLLGSGGAGIPDLEDRPDGSVVATLAGPDGDPAASGRALRDPGDPDLVGLVELWTRPDLRGRGLARAVVAALLSRGAERGARTVWLHVLADNAAAHAVYTAAGLAPHHEARYLRPAPGR